MELSKVSTRQRLQPSMVKKRLRFGDAASMCLPLNLLSMMSVTLNSTLATLDFL